MKNSYPNLNFINKLNSYYKYLHHKKTSFFVFIVTLLSYLNAFAQLSDCGNGAAGQLTVSIDCNPTTFNSNNNSDYWNSAAGCNSSDVDDAWGWFDAVSTSTTITYNSSSDAILHLFSGNCSTGMTALACSDSTFSGDETITYATTIGTRYRIRIQAYNSNNSITGTICITRPCSHPITYCTNNFTNGVYPITNVNFAGINNTTSGNINGNPSQEVFCDTGNAIRGNAYTVSVLGNTGGNNNFYVTAHFDWNHNGNFNDAGERFVIGTLFANTGAGTPVTAIINIPTTALTGQTSMRVISRYFSNTTSCNSNGYGQAEDYLVNITSSASYCNPETTSTASGLYINSVNFVGTLNDTSNPSTYPTSAPFGYQNFTGLANKAIQAQGEGINITARSNGTVNSRGTWKAWVDWNKNGIFEPATEEVYNIQGFAGADATFGFVVPATATPGDYRLRIRVNNGTNTNGNENFGYDFTPCDVFVSGANSYYGEAEDYSFTVIANCDANITSVTGGENCGSGSITLNVTGTPSTTGYKWYTSQNATTAIATTTSGTWSTPSLTATTTYWVTARNATCESVYKTAIIAKVNPTPTITFTPNDPVICGDNTIIALKAGGDKETVYLINEKFENGNLGLFSNINNDSNNGTVKNITSWKNQTSTLVPDTNVWFPAISSGFGTNKFALAYSDAKAPNYPNNTIDNSLTLTNNVNTTNFLNLTLKLKLFYSRYFEDGNVVPGYDEFVNIEVSTNGGSTYTTLQNFTSDIGIGTKFAELSYNLSAYISVTNLKIRIRHRSYAGSGWLPDGVAIDDVELFGEKPLNTSFNYNTSVVDAYTDLACTLPYTTGSPATIIYIKPTVTQLENASFNIPVSTTLSNGCIANGSVTVTNNTKLFTPSAANSDWNTAANWKPVGVPTSSNCIVIYKDVNITGPNNTEKGLNLIVKAGKKLNIASNNSLVITDFINVENTGTLQIENNSNLVQINNVTNIGNIIYKRTANNIEGGDYVYWSSPVINQSLNSIYTSPSQGPKYKWETLLNNNNGTGPNISQGYWVNASGNTMEAAKGYIVRGSSSFGMAATNLNSTFTGVPNNGIISKTVNRGTYTGSGYTGANGIAVTKFDDNHNLIGNPYPSAINALQFLSDNSAVIEGNVKLWTHSTNPGTSITNPFYGSYTYNYTANDYMTINFTGSTTPTASNIIKAGQAFFVVMLDGPTGSGTVNFNNGQRRNSSDIPYANDNFFRSSNQQNVNFDELERHRIWLDIFDQNNASERTLVGYAQGATMNLDSAYDALANPLDMGIYSMINNESYVIQGRSLPFDDNDQVAIGFNVPNPGTYKIAINTADGLFLGTQNVYLKDELLNIYHDLKLAPYSFTATTGVYNNRFKLVYKNTVLSNVTFNENEIQIAKNNNIIDIVSGNETMENVKIFDIRGRLLVEKTNINSNSLSIDMNNVEDQVLIVNIHTIEGIKVTRKIL